MEILTADELRPLPWRFDIGGTRITTHCIFPAGDVDVYTGRSAPGGTRNRHR